jgi:hypothetical protein
MKFQNRVFKLAILLLAAFPAFSQSEEVPDYTVQVGQYASPKPDDFAAMQSHGFLYAIKRSAHTDVYMGGYASEAEAGKALATLQLFGYSNATVTKLNTEGGKPVSVIQLATKNIGQRINWEEYLPAGQLLVLLNGNSVKIMAGTFADLPSAKAHLAKLQKAGYFKGAFAKNVNNVLLHEVGDFEMGGAPKRPLIPLVFEEKKEEKTPEQPKPAATEATKPTEVPKEFDAVAALPPTKQDEKPKAEPAEVTPKGVEAKPAETKKAEPKVEPEKKDLPKATEAKPAETKKAEPESKATMGRAPSVLVANRPSIRPNVKRTSAYELQKALKAEGSYKGSLDGFYGKTTRDAYQLALANNRQLQKYGVLAKHMEEADNDAPNGTLQHHINHLWDDPKAATAGLLGSKLPIARAYRAYHRFVAEGQSKDVNWMMNESLREAYAGKKALPGKLDLAARYDYEGLDQLLLHLRYIHEATPDVSVPCYLFDRHPGPADQAFGPGSSALNMQGCGGFLAWEEAKLLDAIARDLCGLGQTSEAACAKSQSQLAQIYLTPKAPTDEERKALEAWNAKLWQGIEGWSSRDPMLSEIATALKISYLQTEVLLEDYFMDKGFSEREAKALGLQAMKAMVGHHLERFI